MKGRVLGRGSTVLADIVGTKTVVAGDSVVVEADVSSSRDCEKSGVIGMRFGNGSWDSPFRRLRMI